MAKVPTGKVTINFDGLTPQAADKLAAGLAKSAGASAREVFSNLKTIRGMKLQEVENLARIMGVVPVADGNCGNGCAG